MYACICEIGADFSRWCAHPAMQPLISATHPHPMHCTGTNFAPLSVPIIYGNVLDDLRGEEPLHLSTSLNRGPREVSAAIVSL
jgi:hypothetical protein